MTQDVFSELDDVGLQLHAVFELDGLPSDIRTQWQEFTNGGAFSQLILIGNAGPMLWSAGKAAAMTSSQPIYGFSGEARSSWFSRHFGACTHQIIYPGSSTIGLQRLGSLAGWHNASPFKVGINQEWGTWFAYRVALLANTTLAITNARQSPSPCDQCDEKPCIAACPAQAMSSGEFKLDSCIDYRTQAGSRCGESCISRLNCPVGSIHRYDPEQIAHGYSQSLSMILHHRSKSDAA